jgi:hypothetical protein
MSINELYDHVSLVVWCISIQLDDDFRMEYLQFDSEGESHLPRIPLESCPMGQGHAPIVLPKIRCLISFKAPNVSVSRSNGELVNLIQRAH